jgi:hypothetical protein
MFSSRTPHHPASDVWSCPARTLPLYCPASCHDVWSVSPPHRSFRLETLSCIPVVRHLPAICRPSVTLDFDGSCMWVLLVVVKPVPLLTLNRVAPVRLRPETSYGHLQPVSFPCINEIFFFRKQPNEFLPWMESDAGTMARCGVEGRDDCQMCYTREQDAESDKTRRVDGQLPAREAVSWGGAILQPGRDGTRDQRRLQ